MGLQINLDTFWLSVLVQWTYNLRELCNKYCQYFILVSIYLFISVDRKRNQFCHKIESLGCNRLCELVLAWSKHNSEQECRHFSFRIPRDQQRIIFPTVWCIIIFACIASHGLGFGNHFSQVIGVAWWSLDYIYKQTSTGSNPHSLKCEPFSKLFAVNE